MEMKINFNKLFDPTDSDSHTHSTTSLENSYNFDEPSLLSHASNHINLHYKFNQALFFDSQHTMQNQQQINILGDLSSIGRSFEDSFQKQSPIKLAQKSSKITKQTPKLSKTKNQEDYFTKQTFGVGQKNLKTPGQRLYYEHKINQERKLREVERLKMEKQENQKKQVTFKPVINQKSKKILELADSPLRKIRNFKKNLKLMQTQQEIKSTAQKKYEEDLKNCTFKPTLTKTPKNKFTINGLNQKRSKDQVFEELYKDHKLKEMKRKEAELQLSKREKKMSQEQLEQFLSRHEGYLQQKLHKEELMRAVSSQYDLSSGRKLFEPKINEVSETLVSNGSVKRFFGNASSSKLILHEDENEDGEVESSKKLMREKSSGKKKSGRQKSKSSSKRGKQISSKKGLFKKGQKQRLQERQRKGQEGKLQDKKSYLRNKKQFQPLSYQVTRVDEKEQGDYGMPCCSIFNKRGEGFEGVLEDEDKEEDGCEMGSRSEGERKWVQGEVLCKNLIEDFEGGQDEENEEDKEQNQEGDEEMRNENESKSNELGQGEDEGIYEDGGDFQQKKEQSQDIGDRVEGYEGAEKKDEDKFGGEEEQTEWKPLLFEQSSQEITQNQHTQVDKDQQQPQAQPKFQDYENSSEQYQQHHQNPYQFSSNQTDEHQQNHSKQTSLEPNYHEQPQYAPYNDAQIQESHHQLHHLSNISQTHSSISISEEHHQNPNQISSTQNLQGFTSNLFHSTLQLQLPHPTYTESNTQPQISNQNQGSQPHHFTSPNHHFSSTQQPLPIHQTTPQQNPYQTHSKPQSNHKKNWQQVFNSSYSQSQKLTQFPKSHQELQDSVTLQPQDSPKKKPINIASLLKGKKKLPNKTQPN